MKNKRKAVEPDVPSRVSDVDDVAVADRTFMAAKLFTPYKFGSLWWGRDDLIEQKQKHFVRRKDRIGHPLVSLKRGELQDRHDAIPMLVGTSGENLRERVRRRCVKVTGLTASEPGKISFFGSIVAPCMFEFEDLLDGVVKKANLYEQASKKRGGKSSDMPAPAFWYELRTMHPNTDKPSVDASESRDLEAFCKKYHLS